MKSGYILEKNEYGIVVRPLPGQHGVPIETLTEVAKLMPENAVMANGISSALDATFAVCVPENEKPWKTAIEAKNISLSTQDQWRLGCDTGVSSKTIFSALSGNNILTSRPDVPHDADDFGRCYRLLKMIPAWRGRLAEVGKRYPETAWPAMAAAWDELEGLYDSKAWRSLYDRIELAKKEAKT